MDDTLIRIVEIPLWTLIPYALVIAAGLTWTVRWILKHPKPE